MSSAKPVESNLEFAREARAALLEDEGRLLRRLANQLKSSAFRDLLIVGRNRTSTAKRALTWWSQIGGIPREFSILKNQIQQGIEPVFCNISLCLRSMAPTVYIPVPYLLACDAEGGEGSFLLLPPRPKRNAEVAARAFSHAVTNLAYSVRLEDRPYMGYLAQAHAKMTPLYIPDVRDPAVHTSSDTFSAAINEEPFLCMASVLYVPVSDDVLPAVQLPSGEYAAAAVLMFWSPIPDRWETFMKQGPLPTTNAQEFSWLKEELALRQLVESVADSQFLGVVHAFDRWCHDQGSAGLRVSHDLLHGTPDLLAAFLAPDHSLKPLAPWLATQLDLNTGPLRYLANYSGRRLSDARFFMPPWTSEKGVPLSDASELAAGLPGTFRLATNEPSAARLVSEAVLSILRPRARLLHIRVNLSERFCAMSIRFEPDQDARTSLYGSAEAFQRYFATRRGLIVPSAERGRYGLGLALYTRLSTRLGTYRRLYVSPNGTTWSVDVAVPVSGAGHGGRDGA